MHCVISNSIQSLGTDKITPLASAQHHNKLISSHFVPVQAEAWDDAFTFGHPTPRTDVIHPQLCDEWGSHSILYYLMSGMEFRAVV